MVPDLVSFGADVKVVVVTTPEAFGILTGKLGHAEPSGELTPSFILAELNDLLTVATAEQVELLREPRTEDPYLANYVAAMVEQAAHNCGIAPPLWTSNVAALSKPVFAVPWQSVRAHLLLESPIPFRRRNIFINATLGARV